MLNIFSSRRAMPLIRKIISTKDAAAPIGPFSQAVQIGNTLQISGQIGMTVQGDLVEGIEAQTRLTLDSIGHILKAANVSYNNVTRTTVLLSDMANFQVVNKIYSEYFKGNYPARACYQVSCLPKNALIEIITEAVVDDIVDV